MTATMAMRFARVLGGRGASYARGYGKNQGRDLVYRPPPPPTLRGDGLLSRGYSTPPRDLVLYSPLPPPPPPPPPRRGYGILDLFLQYLKDVLAEVYSLCVKLGAKIVVGGGPFLVGMVMLTEHGKAILAKMESFGLGKAVDSHPLLHPFAGDILVLQALAHTGPFARHSIIDNPQEFLWGKNGVYAGVKFERSAFTDALGYRPRHL
ncbi:unnamed protein product [Eruca vesicaria subsp. sativa]|uniref:Uncharacterized protein n=1 Tax=Eruca vesicaria subsp. sativa TaxID=29727 RepID=A0ABC8KCH9_ERUVS|nr:unnamed protein product [Eruca vesicaria subsp. sativa]